MHHCFRSRHWGGARVGLVWVRRSANEARISSPTNPTTTTAWREADARQYRISARSGRRSTAASMWT